MDFYPRTKLLSGSSLPPRPSPIPSALSSLRASMLDKYNCSQAYSELETINRILELEGLSDERCKKPQLDRILLGDLKFDEEEEYMEQLYEDKFEEQLTELFQYYKYYLQDPAVCFHDHRDIMHRYYERRKGHVYNELKKILTLSDVDQDPDNNHQASSSFYDSKLPGQKQLKKVKNPKLDPNLQNILNEITLSRTNCESPADESLQFQELRSRLVKFYGPPSTKSMAIIDSIYNFSKVGYEHLAVRNSRKFYHGNFTSKQEVGEIVARNFKKKEFGNSTRALESTNISTSQRMLNDHHPLKDQPMRGGSARKKSNRRYKSTGNSQDGELITMALHSHEPVSKNKGKKSKLRRKSSDLISNTRNQWHHLRPLMNTEACESRQEQLQKPLKKKKHPGRVRSTDFTLQHTSSPATLMVVTPPPEMHLHGTIAKFKRKINEQKQEIIQLHKANARSDQGFFRTESRDNISQHSQMRKKPNSKAAKATGSKQ